MTCCFELHEAYFVPHHSNFTRETARADLSPSSHSLYNSGLPVIEGGAVTV